jgi:hypothetical protein
MTMKQKLIILTLALALFGCAKAQRSNGNTVESPLPTTSSSITARYSRAEFIYNAYVPRGASPTLYGGLPISGALFYDTTTNTLYQFDSLTSGGTEVWTALVNGGVLGNFVTLNTVQTVAAAKTWNADQTFNGNVGIGGTPSFPLDVQDGGRMYFDGERLVTVNSNGNLLIGSVTGLQMGDTAQGNTAVGGGSQSLSRGDFNVTTGANTLFESTGDFNTATGYASLYKTDFNYSSGFGYKAGEKNYGTGNTAIGGLSGNFKLLDSAIIDNTELVTSSETISGSDVATFISANSLAVGDIYIFDVSFNGVPPTPYGAAGFIAKGHATSSNTIQFSGLGFFQTQGSGTFTLKLYNKQDNAIAIGFQVQTDSSNQIKIGNTDNSILKVNKLVFDLKATPSTGDVLTWDGTKYTPLAPTGGGGTGLVSSVFGRIGDVTAQASDYAAFYPSLTGYNNTNWDVAYNKRPTGVAFSGTSTKTLTMTLGDGTTLTGSFTDNDGSGGTGIISLNGDGSTTQSLATGTSGTDFNISSAAGIHTFNIPTVSATARGLVTSAQKATWDAKQDALPSGTSAQYLRGDQTLATFPTDLGSFANGPGYLTTTTGDARYPKLTSIYADPSWLSALNWSKITTRPNTISGYGITDAVPNTRTVNGKALSSNITLAYSDIGTVPIANGGTGQITANGALNALLPSQTGNSGKILQTDGTNTSWVVPAAGSGTVTQAQLDDSTAAIRNDFPECTTPAFTALSDVSEGSGTYSQTITITATTVPSGTTTHTYYWTKFGHEVHLQMNLKWATAGSGVSKAIIPLPVGMPAPLLPAGFSTVNNTITYGTGGFATDATQRNGVQSSVRLSVDAAGTGYQLVIESNNVGASVGFVNIQYRIP